MEDMFRREEAMTEGKRHQSGMGGGGARAASFNSGITSKIKVFSLNLFAGMHNETS